MSELATMERYGELIEPATLRIQRLLPGPIDRVWSYLTQSELRRQWFAAGDMTMEVGSPVELVWRNDELTDPPGQRPAGSSAENRMQTRITELDPPRKLGIAWGETGAVSFELQPQGGEVLLTIIHSRVPDRARLMNFAPGWHVHLDILEALLTGGRAKPFWDEIHRLKGEYERRLPA
ncbi:SRPBCC family protein [Aureimonas leprariae]|uniref:SRPBCC family protein n=1 Tax=Plantimonas leprariae TaxID=2615207 RepID=A0A7V7PNB5_9HYPH|nr:SRPBCC family protein [Aureimonas leprariae]KAB0679095.1 SRPBCC family protein [Aureimonas leprariae]